MYDLDLSNISHSDLFFLDLLALSQIRIIILFMTVRKKQMVRLYQLDTLLRTQVLCLTHILKTRNKLGS